MKTFKKLLSIFLVMLFVVGVFSVCSVSAVSADTPKVYMRYPGGKTKAFTMGFDDGLANDRMLVEIFAENNLKSTFYLNSGNLGKGSTLLTESEAVELYKSAGMEVASHSKNHPDLPTVYEERGNQGLKEEVLDDIAKLESLFGNDIKGIAYPGAPPYRLQSPEVIKFLKDNGVGYARALSSNKDTFELPKNWHVWEPNCQINYAKLGDFTNKFVNKKVFGDPLLFFVWGHAYDINEMQSGFMLGAFCERISNLDDVWYATNGEVYSYVTDYQKLKIDAKKDTITNPTKRSLWVCCNLKTYEIKAGATVKGILSGTYVEPSKNSSKVDKTSSKPSDKTEQKPTESKEEAELNQEEVVEEIIIEDDGKSKDDGIMQYMWILIVVAAVVILALLLVIFLPMLKKKGK